jgi:hypothetical protein
MKGFVKPPRPALPISERMPDPFRDRDRRVAVGYYRARLAERLDPLAEPGFDWLTQAYADDDDPRAWDSWVCAFDPDATRGLEPLEPDRWHTPADRPGPKGGEA